MGHCLGLTQALASVSKTVPRGQAQPLWHTSGQIGRGFLHVPTQGIHSLTPSKNC